MITMLVNRLKEVYDVEYDVKDKILWIRQPISVAELINIRTYIKHYKIELGDLKVGRFVGGYYDRKRII